MYALHDVSELMVLETFEKREERDSFLSRLYAPPPGADLSTRPEWQDDATLEGFPALSAELPPPKEDRRGAPAD